jgi:hypothetical protein
MDVLQRSDAIRSVAIKPTRVQIPMKNGSKSSIGPAIAGQHCQLGKAPAAEKTPQHLKIVATKPKPRPRAQHRLFVQIQLVQARLVVSKP